LTNAHQLEHSAITPIGSTVSTGQHVPAEYYPLVLEEMNLDDIDLKSVQWRRKPAGDVVARFHVLVTSP